MVAYPDSRILRCQGLSRRPVVLRPIPSVDYLDLFSIFFSPSRKLKTRRQWHASWGSHSLPFFRVLQSLAGTSWAKLCQKKKNCHVGSDLQNGGTSSQLLLRCDDLEKNFWKLPGIWSLNLSHVREFQARFGNLGLKADNPTQGVNERISFPNWKFCPPLLWAIMPAKGEDA